MRICTRNIFYVEYKPFETIVNSQEWNEKRFRPFPMPEKKLFSETQ